MRSLYLFLFLAQIVNTGSYRKVFTSAPGGTATPVIVPFGGGNNIGDNALTSPSPVLNFGKQATSTASMAIPISISNCSNTQIPACSGTGSLTVSSMAISGMNAADFAIAGTCSSISSGSDCEPTITFTPSASSGTTETATLTVTDNGVTSTQTLSLTGASQTMTTVATSSCPTTLAAGNYIVTADISCAGTAFIISGTADINLGGHTVTYGTGTQATQVNAFQNTSFNVGPTIHNGTIAKGAGVNTFSTAGGRPLSSLIGSTGSNAWGVGSFFNLTMNLNFQYANMIDYYNSGSNLVVHDVNFNDTAVGTCASVGCRSSLQSALVTQDGARGATANTSKIYNTSQNGGPQGGYKLDAPGAEMSYNFLNPGNVTGTNTQDFGLFAWSSTANVHHNMIVTPLTASSGARGIQLSDAEGFGSSGKNVHDNIVGVIQLANNAEYSGCQLGGGYGIQYDDNPQGTNTAQNNNVLATTTSACPSSALRVTDSESVNNNTLSNVFTSVRQAGAGTCVQNEWAEAGSNCAYAGSFSMDIEGAGTAAFSSKLDTFTGDAGDFYFAADGAAGVVIQSPTVNKGSNPSGFFTMVASNGPSSPVTAHIIDATFNTGTSATDTKIDSMASGNQGAVSLYIDWTQTMAVTKAGGGAAVGALVTFTDTLLNTYTCTTDGAGDCAVAVTQYRNNNDTAANTHESRNPYALAVVLVGCTTNTTTGITISAPTSRPIVLAGC